MCRYLLGNWYQCHNTECSYLKHILWFEIAISELCFSSSMRTSPSLQSLLFLLYFPHLGLICCVHPFSFVHRHVCNLPLFHLENAQATLGKLAIKLHQSQNLQ